MCSVGILQRYICLHDKWTNNMIVNDKYLYILLSLQPSSVYYMVIHLIYQWKSQENMFDLHLGDSRYKLFTIRNILICM